MRDAEDRTVVACRKGEDSYVLLAHDLDDVRAWGNRKALHEAGVPSAVLERAAAEGSSSLSGSQELLYPWTEGHIQYGDYYVDRQLADAFCEAAQDSNADLSDFFVGSAGWEDDTED